MSYWQIKDTVTNMQSIVRKRLLLESEVDRKVSFQFTYRQPDFVFNFFMPFTYPQIIYCYMIAKKEKKRKKREEYTLHLLHLDLYMTYLPFFHASLSI